MSEPRIIKKYANRRLYDMSASQYVTLEDIKNFVCDHIEFRIIDASSKKDLTNNVLLQIIFEQENQGLPIFTTEMLQGLIRFYGNTTQDMISRSLEQWLQWCAEQQKIVQEQMQENIPLNFFSSMFNHNMSLLQSSMSQMMKSFQQNPDKSKQKTEKA